MYIYLTTRSRAFVSHLPQVHGEWLEGKTQVLLVVEASEQPEAVELVIRVGVVQAPQHFSLFQARLVHDFVAPEINQREKLVHKVFSNSPVLKKSPDNFDGDLSASSRTVTSPHHI